MIIYKITNTINGKIYVGLTTTSLTKRMYSYKSAAKSKKDISHGIVLALRKYGFEQFVFEIIDHAISKQELKQKEIEHIALLKATDPLIGYNVSPGGYALSEEALKLRSAKMTGRKLTEEHKKNISIGNQGHRTAPNAREIALKNIQKCAGWNKGTKGVMKKNSGSFKAKI